MAITSDGTSFLFAVSSDERRHIDLSLVDSAGAVTQLPAQTFRGIRASLGHDGTSFWMAWTQDDNLVASRVSKQGAQLDDPPVFLLSLSKTWPAPLTCTKGQCLVLATDYDGRLWARRLSSSGVVLDPSPLLLAPAHDDGRGLGAVPYGAGYLVAWGTSDDHLHTVHVGLDGTLSSPTAHPFAFKDRLLIGLTVAGDVALVLTKDAASSVLQNGQTWVTRLTSTQLLDPAPQLVGNLWWLPVLSSVGNEFRLGELWASTSVGYRIPVTSGPIVGPQTIHPAQDNMQIEMASSLDQSLVVTNTHSGTFGQNAKDGVFARRWASDGTLPDPEPFRVHRQAPREQSPSVAAGPGGYLALWTSDYTWVASRIAPDGTHLDDPPLELDPASSTLAAVTFDGQDYVVVVTDDHPSLRAVVRRITPQGVVFPPVNQTPAEAVFQIPTLTCLPEDKDHPIQRTLDLVSNGSGSMAFWLYGQGCVAPNGGGGASHHLAALPIGQGGVLGEKQKLWDAQALNDYVRPAFVGIPGGYLIAWDQGGIVLQGGAAKSFSGPWQAPLAVARGSDGYLVAGRQWGQKLYTQWFDPDKGTFGPLSLFDHLVVDEAHMVWDGSAFQLAVYQPDETETLLRFGPDGTLLGQWPAWSVRQPATLASFGAGETLVTYSRLAPFAPEANQRVRGRFVRPGPGPLGALCAVASECASDHCVDGVCCDSACGDGSTSDCLACSVLAGGLVDGTCAPASPLVRCRAKVGPCDDAEWCDGLSPLCPPDADQPDGAPCSQGDPCVSPGSCQGGTCAGEPPSIVCVSFSPCLIAACVPPTGCVLTAVDNGTPCPEGSCLAGSCQPMTDGGPGDAGMEYPDAEAPDAGPPDGEVLDAGSPDGEVLDAGSPDAALPDPADGGPVSGAAGSGGHAGARPSGHAGSAGSAGARPAASAPAADRSSTLTPTGDLAGGGCACALPRSRASSRGVAAMLLAALAAVMRRRRRAPGGHLAHLAGQCRAKRLAA